MYLRHYNLVQKPFEPTPDPRFLYMSEAHREALARLVYGIEERKGFMVLTGEVGTGKTTLLRTVIEELSVDTRVALIINSGLSASDLLRDICQELSLDVNGKTRAELLRLLTDFLLECAKRRENVVILVDEAQGLDMRALEQLRLLANLETSTKKLIQIVLAGQPELNTMLASHELRQLRQRVCLKFHLPALTEKETREYVAHRLRVAGGNRRTFFSRWTLKPIYQYSAGVPRVINLICDMSLVVGYTKGIKRIGRAIVTRVAEENGLAPEIMVSRSPDSPKQVTEGHALAVRIWKRGRASRRLALAATIMSGLMVVLPTTKLMDGELTMPTFGDAAASEETELTPGQNELRQRKEKMPPAGEPILVRAKVSLFQALLDHYGIVNTALIAELRKTGTDPYALADRDAELILPHNVAAIARKAAEQAKYVVHVSSFRKAAGAMRAYLEDSKAGHPVTVVEVEIANRGTWYRLALGEFSAYADAAQFGRKLRREGRSFTSVLELGKKRKETGE